MFILAMLIVDSSFECALVSEAHCGSSKRLKNFKLDSLVFFLSLSFLRSLSNQVSSTGMDFSLLRAIVVIAEIAKACTTACFHSLGINQIVGEYCNSPKKCLCPWEQCNRPPFEIHLCGLCGKKLNNFSWIRSNFVGNYNSHIPQSAARKG